MKFNPYAILAGVIGLIFVVWLFSSMARTEFANRVLFTLVAAIVVVGVAGALSMIGNRNRESDHQN